MVNQCEARYTHATQGELRCQDVEGHKSVHYHDGIWWPNEKGLPFDSNRETVAAVVAAGALIGVFLLGAAVYWMLHR